MLKNYLEKIGLGQVGEGVPVVNDFVKLAFEGVVPEFRSMEIEELYSYEVPKVGDNGVCSLWNEKEEKPYNLGVVLGRGDKQDLLLWRLNRIVDNLQKLTNLDWVGIYKKVRNMRSEPVLLKLAYRGAFSRAEFPLTEEFARGSNNSTVGLSGKAVLVQDVANYAGPYYQCDAKVLSEFCCPILDQDGAVLGIIDAESFKEKFFTEEKILEIAKVCMDLGSVRFYT